MAKNDERKFNELNIHHIIKNIRFRTLKAFAWVYARGAGETWAMFFRRQVADDSVFWPSYSYHLKTETTACWQTLW